MLFDQPRELPVATVRRGPQSKLDVIAGDLVRWLTIRGQWLRPRTVPVLVAFAGMIAVLQAVSYLSQPPVAALDGQALVDDASAREPRALYIERTSDHDNTRLPSLPTREYRGRLVVPQ